MSGPSNTPVRGTVDASTRFRLGRALLGAAARLDQPTCRAVLTDFEDASGRRLDQALLTKGYTASYYLGLIFFADASGHRHCRNGRVGAFTVPGSRVVRVCPRALHRMFRKDPTLVEALLIHELLHSLGLPENPPTSDEIDARVDSRCLARPQVVSGQ